MGTKDDVVPIISADGTVQTADPTVRSLDMWKELTCFALLIVLVVPVSADDSQPASPAACQVVASRLE